MARRPRQIINPYVRFGRKAQGPYAQKLSGGTFGRAITGGEAGPCFEVISVSVGEPSARWFTVCFSAPPDQATCLTLDFQFENVTRGLPLPIIIADPGAGNCLLYETEISSEQDSSGPQDVLEMDYTPGSCHKEGSSEPECVLEAIVDYPVENRIFGPTQLRIGDIADDVLVAVFPADVAQIGNLSTWVIRVQGIQRGKTAQIVNGNEIHFTLDTPASAGELVAIAHEEVAGVAACQAVDGRYCWRFYDEPVENVTGANFWIREDLGQWRTESVGRWQLE